MFENRSVQPGVYPNRAVVTPQPTPNVRNAGPMTQTPAAKTSYVKPLQRNAQLSHATTTTLKRSAEEENRDDLDDETTFEEEEEKVWFSCQIRFAEKLL